MAETTEQYRARINQLKTSIENEPLIKKMRENIAEGISKTGNRQADIEVRQDKLEDDFVAVQQDASSASPSGAEVAVARAGFNTLDERLTTKEQEVNAQLAHTKRIQLQGASLVDGILSMISVRSTYVRNNSTNDGIDVGIIFEDSLNSVVEYNFKYNVDKLLLLRGVKTGNVIPSQKNITPTLKGAFVDGVGLYHHTVTVGDSFEFTFRGTDLDFRLPTEARGGMWEFRLSNGLVERVSGYSVSTTLTAKEVKVFSGLKHGTYQVKAVFIGDDPDNPPSSAPSRGYLYNANSSWTLREENKKGFIDTSTAKYLISPSTIPDFAIAARPSGQSYAHTWVPYHTVSEVSLSPQIKVIIDGTERITTSSQVLGGSGEYRDVESFEMVQSFDANNPNGTQGAMWKHYISHTITEKTPLLSIKNRLEVLQDTSVASTYLSMTGVDSTNISRLVLNNGTEYNSVPNDGTEIEFDYDVSSAMYAGEYETGRYHATAIDVEAYSDAVGLRKRLPSDKTMPGLLTFRADGIAKFYLKTLPNNSVMRKGEVYKNTQNLICITGVRYPNVLLKNI